MKLRKKRRAMNVDLVPADFGKKEKYADTVCSILLSAMLFIGLGGLLINMLGLPVIGVLPAVCGTAVIAAFFLLSEQPAKKKLIALGCLAAAVLTAWFIAFKYARAGFYVAVNHISSVLNIEAMRINVLFETGVSQKLERGCTTLFLSLVSPVLAAFCAWLVKNSCRFLGGFMLAAVAGLGVFEAVNSTGIWSVLLCAAVALTIMRFISGRGFAAAMPVVCAVLLAGAGAGAASVLLFAGGSLDRMEIRLSHGKAGAQELAHSLKYEKGAMLMMPEGDFYRIKQEYAPSFETVLDVTMSDCEEVPSVYLRGYVGEVYTDDGWRPLSKRVLGEYSSLFYQLHKNGFYPQAQLAMVSDILDDGLDENSLIKVEVSNEAACRGFAYAPYELYRAEKPLLSEDYIGQTGLRRPDNVKEQEYEYYILPNQVKRYDELDKMLKQQSQQPSQRLSDYLSMESKYRSFVYSQYTDISDEDKKLLSGFLGEGAVAGQSHISYDDARKNIFKVLGDMLEYEENVEKYEGDVGFLRFVMKKLQYGYAPHYATVTTMMLRYYGIPARYVEGYVITPDDAESVDPGDELAVTDYSAHAWAEYYHDGIGWLPLDTSPNFANIMEGTGAPPEYIYEQPADSSQEEEQEPPEYDKNRHDKDKEDEMQKNVKLALPWILLLLLILLAAFAWYYRRKKIFEARRKACEDPDNNKAVRAMMEYMQQLLVVCGIKDSVNSPAGLVGLVGEKWGVEWEQSFGRAMIAFLKATFSNGSVKDAEREAMTQTLKDMLQKVDSLQNRRSRFVLKYIKCLY